MTRFKVFMFDRDDTVIPPLLDGKEGIEGLIPIDFVRRLAHETPHHVWATGNQRLTSEAEIPGLAEAKKRWNAAFDEAVEDRYECESVKKRGVEDGTTLADDGNDVWTVTETWEKPKRRDGLRIIKDLYVDEYEPPPDFVVIDNIDLSDMEDEGIEYCRPEEFEERFAAAIQTSHE